MDILFKIILSIGIPSIILALIYIGRKLQSLDDMGGNISDLKIEIAEIKVDCKNIWQIISRHGEDICSLKTKIYGSPGSPMKPNENGKKLLEDSGFYKIYPELKDELFALMDSYQPRTLYDYEKIAEKVLSKFQNNPLMDPLKEYVVNNQNESLELIFRVAAWVIRDDYAEYKSK